jgi:hypothetical protein
MRTELARVQTEAQKESFIRNGFSMYTFHTNTGCCDVCAALNGKHFKISKMQYGYNAPPVHPFCRCSVSAYEDTEEYNEWLDYVSKGGSTAEWNKMRAKSAKKDIAKSSKSSTMKLKDILIHKSVGAKAKNYEVMDLETGEFFHFTEGTRLYNVEVFAGKGTKKELKIAEKYANRYGGNPEDWQHVKGFGTVDTFEGERDIETHWMQCEGVGKFDFFVKRWLDEG